MAYCVELRRQDADGPMIVFPDQYEGHVSVEEAINAIAVHARRYAMTHSVGVLVRIYGESGHVVMGSYIRPEAAT